MKRNRSIVQKFIFLCVIDRNFVAVNSNIYYVLMHVLTASMVWYNPRCETKTVRIP
jgi:hypothetical protein